MKHVVHLEIPTVLPINSSYSVEYQQAVHAHILEGGDVVNFMGSLHVKNHDNKFM